MYALIKFSDETYYVRKVSQLRAFIHDLCAKKRKITRTRHKVEFVLRHRKLHTFIRFLKNYLRLNKI